MTIELALCEGFSVSQIVSDKFLLLATPVSSDCLCQKELCKLWKVRLNVFNELTPYLFHATTFK